MATLRGDPAAVIARLLPRNPAARHFAELNENRGVDECIRRAVR
jgi:hypothetical protein